MAGKRGRVCVCCRKIAPLADPTKRQVPPVKVPGPFPALNRVEARLWDLFPMPAEMWLSVRRADPSVFIKQHGFPCFGDCTVADDHSQAWIRLGTDLAERELIDTLIHEWPHALRFLSPVPAATSHDELYWQIHGQVYRAVYGD